MLILSSGPRPIKYPYSIFQLYKDNPQTSFPEKPSDALLEEFGVFSVDPTQFPSYDSMTERVEEGMPELINGKWTQTWKIIELSEEEIAGLKAAQAETIRLQRAEAYRTESDPIFFKWQRGETNEQEWLDKITEIKARFPE